MPMPFLYQEYDALSKSHLFHFDFIEQSLPPPEPYFREAEGSKVIVKSCLVPFKFNITVAKLRLKDDEDVFCSPHLVVSTNGARVPCTPTDEERTLVVYQCSLKSELFQANQIEVQAMAMSGVQSRSSKAFFYCTGNRI